MTVFGRYVQSATIGVAISSLVANRVTPGLTPGGPPHRLFGFGGVGQGFQQALTAREANQSRALLAP